MILRAKSAETLTWHVPCLVPLMLTRIARLFTIKTKFEAFLVIYGLGSGAVERGIHYLHEYPGLQGRILFAVCPLAVFMAGGRILESIDREARE